MIYYDILSNFYKDGVKYLIVGGLAVNIHGVPRLTQDIDIIISMEKDNILKLCQCLNKLGYKPRLPVNPEDLSNPVVLNEWVSEKNMKAFSFYNKENSLKVVDIVISHPLDFNLAYSKKEEISIKQIKIPVVALDDLIKMKESSGRGKDLSDIKMLNKIKEIEKELKS